MLILDRLHMGHKDVNDLWKPGPDSAGGLSVGIHFQNDTQKTIKYAYFEVVPYNAVKDVQSCTISGKSLARLKLTGPIAPGKSHFIWWENTWYNKTITDLDLAKVEVLYMDGSSETLTGADIKYKDPSEGGCYVATAVYGSYDCPQVWTLRRFRDYTLAASWYGRAFIRVYYAVSPTLVKWFGRTAWFQKLWRGPLDRLVTRLRDEGVADTPIRTGTGDPENKSSPLSNGEDSACVFQNFKKF